MIVEPLNARRHERKSLSMNVEPLNVRRHERKNCWVFFLSCLCVHEAMWLGTLRRKRKRRLKMSEFAFFWSLSWLFPPTYFVKCRRTFQKLNSMGPYRSSKRETNFRRCLFTFSIEIRHYHVVVVQKRQRNAQNWSDARAKLLLFAN